MNSTSLGSKIQSLRENVGGAFRKPDPATMAAFRENLAASREAMDYLTHERGLSEKTIEHFKLGYDPVRHAIAIPIYKRGELINIKYRLLKPEGPKYTQEKDCEVWIYNEEGIQKGLEKRGILVVEGEFDLMSTWQAGIHNVVSPASGKDSYGIWLELLDSIPKVYIAYDNDKAGKDAAFQMAERVGVEKCSEVIYPEGFKDANDYFRKNTNEDFKKLISSARPFYAYQFKGVVDIINDLRFGKTEALKLNAIPEVKIGEDWLVVISGKSNVGKTSYVMNIANELTQRDIPCLVLPFERGPQVVGTRFLQVKFNRSEGEFLGLDSESWDEITKECVHTPLYFAMPNKNETFDVIRKSKRIFNTKVVIVDHLDYMVRHSNNKESEIGNTLQELKRLAEELKVVVIIVTHIRKIDAAGSQRAKKPNIEDLKGSASLYQDPECVVMLTSPQAGLLDVNVVKNKGKMTSKVYGFNQETGKLGEKPEDDFGSFSN